MAMMAAFGCGSMFGNRGNRVVEEPRYGNRLGYAAAVIGGIAYDLRKVTRDKGGRHPLKKPCQFRFCIEFKIRHFQKLKGFLYGEDYYIHVHSHGLA